ncbi:MULTISPECIES: DUF397 domain-containing protein [Streptomyces]|uniref:DUF397 domain-containing protein n=1 Tax=Streptomyces TaxID=1883 RepID=UPI000F774A61|nr:MULTISPECIES: DUF397 domain-containing protein [Streptomyces]RST07452.1 DUF397 domain-containing protein [Streptomyces sp. WAC07149]GLX18748.1 toxin [Streptomyces lavendulae subsp. lavendulae]GLX29329.1 toxin [Streptomyces lavendulae subsp. lavendulae]
MSNSDLRWFKSSYSSNDGDNCVEVALSWHKSTYSGSDGDNCVEVAACADTVHVRDSKVAAGPELALAPAAWVAFLGGVTD